MTTVAHERLTHAQLVERAGRWLRNTRGLGVVLTERVSSAPETPDAIGWKYAGRYSELVECKASRADFLADAGKWFRKRAVHGMGRLRWYMAMPAVIAPDELPSRWGLVEVRGSRCCVVVKAQEREAHEYACRYEIGVMFSELYRLQVQGDTP